jgi:hypothetical protein
VSKNKRLSAKQLQFRVDNRLRKYDNLNFFESFAMFMGKAQLVELSLWPAPGSEDTELGCFDGAGGGSWRDGSLPASSNLRLCA